jgi:hypothetical protein
VITTSYFIGVLVRENFLREISYEKTHEKLCIDRRLIKRENRSAAPAFYLSNKASPQRRPGSRLSGNVLATVG